MSSVRLTALVLGTVTLMAVAACRPAAPAGAPPPARPVEVAIVEDASLGEHVKMVGVLAAKDEVRLSFKTAGIIEAINVEEGSVVRRGQLLARLRSTEVDAQVRQAREGLEKAERDLDRGRALYADEVATREQVEDLQTLVATSRASLAAADFNARYARIEAPADGIVLRKIAQTNELVQSAQPVLLVSSLDRGWVVRGAFADRDVVRVHRGDTAAIQLDAFPGHPFAGTVTEVGSSADPLTGTFTVEYRVEPDGAAFASGMIARIDVARAAGATGAHPVVPLTSLIAANGDSAYVFVVEPRSDVAHRRSVRLGPTDGLRITVTAGLAPGDRIVAEGAAYLNDGDRVRSMRAGADGSYLPTGGL